MCSARVLVEAAVIKDLTILLPVEFALFERTIEFYSTVFQGNSTLGKSELGHPFCLIEGLGVAISIHTARHDEFPYPEFQPTGHGIALSLEVDDLDETCNRLEKHSVSIRNQWNYADGTRGISIADPAGNRIELWGP